MFRYSFLSLLAFLAFSELWGQRVITGRIMDEYDEPIPGALVQLSKKKRGRIIANTGAVANMDGYYSVVIHDEAKYLRFSSFGSEILRVAISDKDTINIKLKEEKVLESATVHKPVIYLYPQTTTDIRLEVDFNGEMDFTYPAYNNGWNVTARPDGKLIDKADDREHDYLFWDGKMVFSKEQATYDSGFVVHKDSLVSFFQKTLPQMGLLPHEYNDLIVFWTPLMQKHEWNFIHFRTGAAYDIVSTNKVSPEPDTKVRVFMDIKKVEKPFDIPAQIFSAPERKGFTLVEWGGAELQEAYFNVPRKVSVAGNR